jgi:aspartokinase-like uncharacterized kinase
MWVVKLGGSLFNSDNLKNWLAVLAKAQSLVIVPGGGPFADQVRQAQRQWRFDDANAHLMALLAMEQFGRMLCGLQPGLVAAADRSRIEMALARGETPVWMPSAMTMADPGVEQSWRVTSDSLAAWLCGELGADKLLLVKSLPLGANDLAVEQLSAAGIIDDRFAHYLQQSGSQALVMSEGDHACFPEARGNDGESAARIVFSTGE